MKYELWENGVDARRICDGVMSIVVEFYRGFAD